MPLVKLSTGTVHYSEGGQGAPIVLLHANPGEGMDFEAVVPALAKNYRVLALDWPGFGQSDMPQHPEAVTISLFDKVLREFIAELGLPPAFFIGNSVGGNVAARLAIESPDLVRGLVLVAPGGFTPHNFFTRTFCRFQGSRFAFTPYRWAKTYLKGRTETTRAMLQRASTVQALPERVALNRALWRNFLKPEHDLRGRAHKIVTPVLFIFGEQDPAIPAKKDGEVAKKCVPSAQFVTLPCAHEAFAEVPDLFIAQVLPFLEANA